MDFNNFKVQEIVCCLNLFCDRRSPTEFPMAFSEDRILQLMEMIKGWGWQGDSASTMKRARAPNFLPSTFNSELLFAAKREYLIYFLQKKEGLLQDELMSPLLYIERILIEMITSKLSRKKHHLALLSTLQIIPFASVECKGNWGVIDLFIVVVIGVAQFGLSTFQTHDRIQLPTPLWLGGTM